jgi:hypothetical protein
MNARAEPAATAPNDPVAPLALGALDPLVGFHLARAMVQTHAVYERAVGQRFGLKKV